MCPIKWISNFLRKLGKKLPNHKLLQPAVHFQNTHLTFRRWGRRKWVLSDLALLLVACLFFLTLNFLFDILLRDSLAILGFTKKRGMVNFLLSMRNEHFYSGTFLRTCVDEDFCWPPHSVRSFLCLSGILQLSWIRRDQAGSWTFGRLSLFQSPSALNFHSPSIAVLSSTIDDRYATLPFTTDPRTCIHHRPLRFHSPSTAALSFRFHLLSEWVCKVSIQG